MFEWPPERLDHTQLWVFLEHTVTVVLGCVYREILYLLGGVDTYSSTRSCVYLAGCSVYSEVVRGVIWSSSPLLLPLPAFSLTLTLWWSTLLSTSSLASSSSSSSLFFLPHSSVVLKHLSHLLFIFECCHGPVLKVYTYHLSISSYSPPPFPPSTTPYNITYHMWKFTYLNFKPLACVCGIHYKLTRVIKFCLFNSVFVIIFLNLSPHT